MWSAAVISKWALTFPLFVSFVVLIGLAIDQLRSEQTITVITAKREPTPIPSLTLCEWDVRPEKATYINYTDILKKFGNGTKLPLHFALNITSQTMDNYDLLDAKVLQSKFNTTWESVWSINCKFHSQYSDCSPCVTFTCPKGLEFSPTYSKIWLHINELNHAKDFSLEVHDAGQSKVLFNGIDQLTTFYLRLKDGVVK